MAAAPSATGASAKASDTTSAIHRGNNNETEKRHTLVLVAEGESTLFCLFFHCFWGRREAEAAASGYNNFTARLVAGIILLLSLM